MLKVKMKARVNKVSNLTTVSIWYYHHITGSKTDTPTSTHKKKEKVKKKKEEREKNKDEPICNVREVRLYKKHTASHQFYMFLRYNDNMSNTCLFTFYQPLINQSLRSVIVKQSFDSGFQTLGKK